MVHFPLYGLQRTAGPLQERIGLGHPLPVGHHLPPHALAVVIGSSRRSRRKRMAAPRLLESLDLAGDRRQQLLLGEGFADDRHLQGACQLDHLARE